MKKRTLTQERLREFERFLRGVDRSAGTIDKYLRDVGRFARWLAGREVTREETAAWRAHLQGEGYAAVTVNSMLAALNTFLGSVGWEECRARFLKVQRRPFRDPRRELTRGEYEKLLRAARQGGGERLALLLETMVSTGIRVSEVRYITVEAARTGRTEVVLKGKVRSILLPERLCAKLLGYAADRCIPLGEIFRTREGRSLSRRQIWLEMKHLCAQAQVDAQKVFPHNLRHLFATVHYRAHGDIVRLADVLGHSSIETTRIYLATSGAEHLRQLEQLRLVQ